jgi:hypothetical protein
MRAMARLAETRVGLSVGRAPHPLGLPVLVFVAVALLALAYIAYVLWPRWPGPAVDPAAPPIPVTVAGITFNLPPAAIRVPVQRRPGTHERIDLAFLWPSLEPPALSEKPKPSIQAATVEAAQGLNRLFVTLAAAANSVAPAERAVTIYPRYAESEAIAGPGGLSVLPFRDGTPYQGEDLIYDAQAPGFLVRCTRAAARIPGICLYERWVDGAKLIFRFPRDWLSDWRRVSRNIDRLVASWRPSQQPSG